MPVLSRRTFLRGSVGGATVALALPTLEAMIGPRGAYADGSGPGPFFGVFFWANGVPWHGGHGGEQAGHPDVWTPGATGAGFAPSEMLTDLARHRVSVVTGLEPKTAIPASPPGQGDGHMRGFMVAMTGDRIRPEGFDHPSHTLTALRPSIDQVVAGRLYGDAPPRYRSLHLGVSTARFHDYGHWNAISYNGPDSLNLPTLQAARLWDQLFDLPGDVPQQHRRSAVLDSVLEDGRDLQRRLGARDRARVEAHLEHLFEIQRRLDDTGHFCDAPSRPRNVGGLAEQSDTMAELLATALRCGLTRVFTYMLTSPGSTHRFSNLGVPDGMHKTCHDGHWERVRAITAYQMECFGRFLDVMAATRDPMGESLLDRGLIFGTSEYGEGWKHGNREHPVVLAGGACGRLARGVHVRRPGGNIADAHLTMLRALGMETRSWGWNGGETTQHLAGLI